MDPREAGRLSMIMAAATCAAASAGFELPANAQFPDVLSAEECPGCREPYQLAGTWSTPLTSSDDPAWRLEDFFCFIGCTAEARSNATAVLANPANATRPWTELYPKVVAENARSASTLARGPADAGTGAAWVPLEISEPSFACDPRGFASQVVSPLPLKIEQRAGHVVLRYEELGVERTLTLETPGARSQAPTSRNASMPFGVSTARFENGALVVETTDIPAGRLHAWFGGTPHSDGLRAIERYTTSDDGNSLELVLELEDPEALRQPLVITKRWRRVPGAQILHYACDVMSGQLENVFAEYVDPAKLDARRRNERTLQTFAPRGHTICSANTFKSKPELRKAFGRQA
jgi:hypothetical protein